MQLTDSQDQDGAMYSKCRSFEDRDFHKSYGSTLTAGMPATRGAKPAACIRLARPESAGKRSVPLVSCLIDYCETMCAH